MDSEQIGRELRRMHFVHCAIPDISLNGVKTDFAIGGTKLSKPIVILAEGLENARRIAKERKTLPVVFLDGDDIRMIETNGEDVALAHGFYLVKAADGLMAAKILRYDAKAIPYIPKEEAKNAGMYLQQLKMAMFLTNSDDIGKVRTAPVYIA